VAMVDFILMLFAVITVNSMRRFDKRYGFYDMTGTEAFRELKGERRLQ
jgi:hypothetical protein